MFTLPVEIQNVIQDYAGTTEFWKKYFSMNILKEINQGWRLTGLMNVPCDNCYEQGHSEQNTECTNCFIQVPCINCYWYNYFDSEYMQNCMQCTEHSFINWKQIKNFMINDSNLPNTYTDFLQSLEWIKTVNKFKKNKIEIDNQIIEG